MKSPSVRAAQTGADSPAVGVGRRQLLRVSIPRVRTVRPKCRGLSGLPGARFQCRVCQVSFAELHVGQSTFFYSGLSAGVQKFRTGNYFPSARCRTSSQGARTVRPLLLWTVRRCLATAGSKLPDSPRLGDRTVRVPRFWCCLVLACPLLGRSSSVWSCGDPTSC